MLTSLTTGISSLIVALLTGFGMFTIATPTVEQEIELISTSVADHDHEPAETVMVSAADNAEFAALGAEAEAMISYDWAAQLPGWTVKYQGDSAGYKGLTHRPTKTVTIYIDAGSTAHDVAEILAHEIGHALDITHFNDDQRVEWLEARNMPMTWWAGEGVSDFHSGAGDFAEAVAALWVDSPSKADHGEFTEAQLALAAEMLP